jgi:uncharacterized membrane protein
MDRLRDFLAAQWFDSLLLGGALVLGAYLLRVRRRRGGWSIPGLMLVAAPALLGLGGLVVPHAWGLWLAGAALLTLFGALLVVVVSGRWWAPLGHALGGLLLLGLGGLAGETISKGLVATGRVLLHLEAMQPAWLAFLVLVPLVVLLSFRSLAGLGPVRRWLAIGLRCALVTFLTLALAEVRLRHPNETVTVLFLVDRSSSIPEEPAKDPTNPSKTIDRRWERIKRFINEAVEKRGPGHADDKAGVIVFGRRPRLELPPSDVKRLNFTEVTSTIDNSYTDIGAAIKLALASFPEGTGKRIVLVSDGNENLGNAEEQARIAKTNGVQIDVVPLAEGYRNENEVLVQSVEAPPLTEQSSQIPIRVLVRSFNPRPVFGKLVLRQISDGVPRPVPPSPMEVTLHPGLNPFSFKQTLSGKQESYTYEAIFQPEGVLDEKGAVVTNGLEGDRTENNRATTHVIARGRRRVLLVEPKEGDHHLLQDRLETIGGESKFQVVAREAGNLPQDKEELGVFLSKFDCVVLANVPAELLSDDQQEMIRSNTHDQGCGLIMIGGPESFGAGGWQGTAVEKALPVDCDIKALKVQGKGGLVLIMHASEMADGNRWQKEIAKLAIKKLSPMDEVGVLYFDWGTTKWHIPLQVIGSGRGTLLNLVDKMVPGDMPEFDTGLQMAYSSLTEPRRQLATKHIIIISDGDPAQSNQALLKQMKEKKVTVTTVGVATHGAPQDQALNSISKATGGRFYSVKSPKALPAIYIKETRLVSQSFVEEKPFAPQLLFKSGPTEKLPDKLPNLYGYVRTTQKDAFPPVQLPIMTAASGQDFPILAFWNYGLGKSVAFTSDARTQLEGRKFWDRDWAESDIYLKFWEQVVGWSLRAVETGRMTMTTEYRDGRVKVVVDARDNDNRPLTDLRLRGAVTPPSVPGGVPSAAPAKMGELKFEQKSSGVYEAEFKADEAGSFFINAQAWRQVKTRKDGQEFVGEESFDSVRSGVTIPYSPEFADLESNSPLLKRLRELTGGQAYKDEDASLAEAAQSGDVFRLSGLPPSRNLQPIWYWLLLLTGVFLFFDVAVRRIAIDPREVALASQRVWGRLRGRVAAVPEAPQFLDRLKSRKAEIGEALERARAARRFQTEEVTSAAAPAGAHEIQASPPRSAVARPAPAIRPEAKPAEEEPADYTSRLLKAKKRVWEERHPDKPA